MVPSCATRCAFVPVLLICAALTGCSVYRAPTIAVAGAEVIETTDEAMAIRFALDLTNLNDEALELLQFDYGLSVDGRRVYSGRRAAEATLRAGGEKRLFVPAVLRYDLMGWETGAQPPDIGYKLSGSLLYVTPGEIAEILLDTGVRKPRVRFSSAGRIALREPD
ncbi:MAG: LEA type 2 family protein [Phycisphaerales bacterium]|nr:MAG: LEA type 2 family protein [Phycisphaerales bacterium]